MDNEEYCECGGELSECTCWDDFDDISLFPWEDEFDPECHDWEEW